MFGIYDFSNNEESIKNSEIINQKLDDITNPPSLDDLLQLEGIIDELQNKNKKLINFFTKEKIKQMLDYIIKEPKSDDQLKGHKFPFICSKLFNIEEKNIMNYFHLTNKELSQLQKESSASQNNFEKSNEHNINIDDNDEDNLAKYYKINNHENFDDDLDEVNMDDIDINMGNMENGGVKETNKDDNEDNDNVNYKDDIDIKNINDNNKEKINDNNLEENIKDFDFNDDKKFEEDDLVNHNDEVLVNHNDGDKNAENGLVVENNENNNKDKIENGIKDEGENNKMNEEKINNKNVDMEEDLINIQNDKDLKENNEEIKDNKEIIDEIKNKDKEIKKEEKIKKEEEIKEKDELNQVKEIKEEYPEDRIEILDYFLSFVLTDNELNYVLCGYFASLMTILLNNYYFQIINYLFFKRKDILIKFIYHAYRKSIAETLYKIINYEDKLQENNMEYSNDTSELNLNELSTIRLEILKNIFDTININMDSEKLSSMSYLIHDLTKNKNIFETLINNNYIINSLIKKQLSELNFADEHNVDINIYDKKNNFIIICDIIILWLNTIIELDMQIPMLLYEVNEDLEEDTVQQQTSPKPELHHTLLSQALVDILPNLLKNIFNENNTKDNNTIIESNKDEKITPLGLYRIKIVELITNLIKYFKNIPNELDNLLINCDFIENAFNYIFKYTNNNIYQEALLQFFKILFKKEEGCPEHEILYEYLFSKFNLLEKIKSYFPKNGENEGNTGIGYTSFLVSLSYKINSVIGGTPINLEKNYAKEGSMTFTTRGNNLKINGIYLSFNIKGSDEKEEKEEIKNSNFIPSLGKYCNDEWKYFFSEKIGNKIRLYENNLYEVKNNSNSLNKEDDLFYSPINDDEKEGLLDFGNKRYYNNKNDINKLEFGENNDNGKNMANFKDMEININEYNFGVNDKEDVNNINNNEEENSEFNYVNYWKNDLEKEQNSYYNKIGEDAMKDLLDK